MSLVRCWDRGTSWVPVVDGETWVHHWVPREAQGALVLTNKQQNPRQLLEASGMGSTAGGAGCPALWVP